MQKNSINNEPPAFGNVLLSAGASELLNKLVLDLKSKLPPEERVYNKKDNASLIYNLFKGNYEFSYKQYKEVYDALCACCQLVENKYSTIMKEINEVFDKLKNSEITIDEAQKQVLDLFAVMGCCDCINAEINFIPPPPKIIAKGKIIWDNN